MSLFERRRTVVFGESPTLKVFLMSRLQPWRWPVLLAAKAIRVERNRVSLDSISLDDRLTAGDVVVIDDVSGTAWSSLTSEATRSWRDYVFAVPADGDDYVLNKREVVLRDPHAIAVPATIKHLKALVGSLTLAGLHPIRHLVIVAHGNVFGEILIPVREKAGPQDLLADYLSWDSAKEAVKERYLRIGQAHPFPTTLPRPTTGGKPVPCGLLIRGCRAGIHTHLLAKIREAFGDAIDTVVMSKYYEAADFIGKVSPTVYAAAIEYLMHEFTVTSKQKLDRKGVIEALRTAKFADWLAAPVPDSEWEALVPANVDGVAATREIRVTVPGRDRQAVLRARFDGTPMATQSETITQSTAPTAQQIRDVLVARWDTLAMFKDEEWPIWKRMGLESRDAFIEFWNYEVDTAAKAGRPATEWPVRGTRFNYLVRTPLVDNGTLVCNYYPVGERGTASTGIDLNDDRLFGRASFIHPTYSQRV